MKAASRLGMIGTMLWASIVQAQDCEELPQILRNAYGAEQPLELHRVVCKVWPARSELTLVAVPLVRVAEQGSGETDLELLVVESRTQKVVARRLEKHLLDWDAIYVSSLAFDTARYWIAEGQLAFGVRVGRTGSSRVNPYGENFLNLYLLEGQQLRPVLNKLEMESSRGEWDSNCTGEWTDKKRTLAMGEKPGRSGYYDLLLREKASYSRAEARGDDCVAVEEKTQQQRYRLVYDGMRYPVPGTLGAIQ